MKVDESRRQILQQLVGDGEVGRSQGFSKFEKIGAIVEDVPFLERLTAALS